MFSHKLFLSPILVSFAQPELMKSVYVYWDYRFKDHHLNWLPVLTILINTVSCSFHTFLLASNHRILVSSQIFYSMQSHMGQKDMINTCERLILYRVITCRQTGSNLASKIISMFRQLHMKLQFHLLLLFLFFSLAKTVVVGKSVWP